MEFKRVPKTQEHRLTASTRAALAYIYLLSEERENMDKVGMPTNIFYIFPVKFVDDLQSVGMVEYRGNKTIDGQELPNVYITDYGRAIARKHGLSSRVYYIPENMRNYRFVPKHLLVKAVNVIISLLAFWGEEELINNITRKLNAMTISSWKDEWNNMDK